MKKKAKIQYIYLIIIKNPRTKVKIFKKSAIMLVNLTENLLKCREHIKFIKSLKSKLPTLLLL